MNFAYEGFKQEGARRCFLFRGTGAPESADTFSIGVDLKLLAHNQVLIQEGPAFCLRLLTTASVAGPDFLQRFHAYEVVGEDFRPLLIEREAGRAAKALRKTSRPPFRKPAPLNA